MINWIFRINTNDIKYWFINLYSIKIDKSINKILKENIETENIRFLK